MSVADPKVAYIDGEARRVYLLEGVDAFHWIEDIYREVLQMRATDELLQVWYPFMIAKGNETKDPIAGKYTPRYVIMQQGFRAVPFDENILITVTGEAITDNPEVDSDPFDTSTRVNPLKLYITPPAAEIVRDTESLAAIARMAFDNIVTVDPEHGDSIAAFTGDALSLGSIEHPVDNWTDAVIIANRMHIEDFTCNHANVIGAGVDLTGMSIKGGNAMRSSIDIHLDADCSKLEIRDTLVTGTLDGDTLLRECLIDGINYFNGMIHECAFTPTPIKLAGTSAAMIMVCKWYASSASPAVIDCDHQPTPLILSDWVGSLIIKNRTVDAMSSILFSGKIVIDESCTAGTFNLAGIGEVINNSTGTCVVDDSRVVSGIRQRKIYNELINTAELNAEKTLTIITDENGVESHRHAISADKLTRSPA